VRWIYSHSGLLGVAWAIVILVLCATPGQYIPSADWMELLSIDKLVHAAMFLVLALLIILSAVKRNKATPLNIAAIVTAGVFYGVILELMQAWYFSNRSSDWLDVTANSFGCFISLLFLRIIKRLKAELQQTT
jgi:VanZ family protein